ITNEWAKKDTDKKKKKVEVKELVVSLDYEECLKTFNKIQEQIKGADLFFDKNQKIDVSYEDLSRDYKSEMKKIQDFLQLDQESVSTNLEKQNNLPLSQSISNYFELKAKFKNTPWIVFFED
ncbi:MAG: sulfotransferase, partial [Crocosphaera sp.]|nr:sulfotransferase [Crocosphaera sp.]